MYVEHLSQELLRSKRLIIITPDHEANIDALAKADPRIETRLLGRWASDQSSVKRTYARLLGVLDRAVRRVDPSAPPLTFLSSLYFDPKIRSAIRSADIVDLQWFEFIRLASHVRRLNPRAKITGTYHDVLSQLFSRNAEHMPAESRRWLRAAALAHRAEQRSFHQLDRVLTLNDKDAALLTRSGAEYVTVVNPPLSPVETGDARPPTSKTNVVFVAYFGRAFNVQAAEWFVLEVWPLIRSTIPQATFELVGADPDSRLETLTQGAEGIIVSGFIDDLTDVYARAAVIVVPLQAGSGVKFKTIEAITHGVPTISTSVGAEGVVAVDEIEAVVDDADEFAHAVIAALSDLDAARNRAGALAAKVRSEFGPEQFTKTMREVYALPEKNADFDHVTVVIPFYGDPSETLALIEQLRTQDGVQDIVVSDDASPIPFPNVAGVRVVRRAANGGFGAAVNTGAAQVSTNLMLVLNSDLELGATFVRDLLRSSSSLHPAIVSPQILKPSGAPEWTARRFPRVSDHVVEWLSPLARWRHLPALHRAVGHVTNLTPGGVNRTDWVIGAAMLIPVAEFRAIGGFDERFYMTSEEVDLQLRLGRMGVPSYVVNGVSVTHLGGGSSDATNRRQWLVTARQRYALKWGGDRTLSSSLAVASMVNFLANGIRELAGRDVDARAVLRYELGLLRRARHQSRSIPTPGDHPSR